MKRTPEELVEFEKKLKRLAELEESKRVWELAEQEEQENE